EGARYGAVNCSPPQGAGVAGTCSGAEVQDWTASKSHNFLAGSSGTDVTVGWFSRGGTASNHEKGDSVIVKANKTYTSLFLPLVSYTVTSCADMRLEQNDNGSGLADATVC